MSLHPAFAEGNVAVITGGADGIGFEAAKKYLSFGMKVCIADINEEKLQTAAEALGDVLTVKTDVTNMDDLNALKAQVLNAYGQVNVLMNNAGIVLHNTSWGELDAWKKVLDVNLNGVIHGIHCFVEDMLKPGTPGLIINTGSKQGITCPPGNPAYNTSKAALRAVTELLQDNLRKTPNCQVSAHLLVPGFTYTGMIKPFLPEKPDFAWTPDQVIDLMVERISRGDFYIICPDNDATEAMDKKRMEWAMGDLINNRSALSRWDEKYKDEFEKFMEEK